ncbi:MAG: hypothetical protein PGN13_09120 [Patulibacter minatonensis]
MKVRLLTVAVGAGLVTLAGCGSVSQAPEEPAAKPVQLKVQPAKFDATKQLPGDQVTLSMTITNTGANPVDNLIVTLQGTRPDQVQLRENANPNDIPQGTDDLPNTVKRKAWFIDDGPQHAPLAGGDSWNGGSLAPGRTKTLRWSMAAITSGTYTLKYFVSGGLTDKAAKATSGEGLEGTVKATIGVPGDGAREDS